MGYTRREKQQDKKLGRRKERIRQKNYRRRLRGARDRNRAARRWFAMLKLRKAVKK